MTINPPKCAVNMEQRLAALRRDQEIDGLRVYLIKYNLFPRNRDPHNSPIRLEELKELVKHWKLHRQRGFWRDHPDKDDLVRALLQHIKSEAANKKRRQEAQDKYRSKTLGGADDGSPGKLRDLTTFFGGGNVNGSAEGDQNGGDNDREQVVAVAKKKNFGGDLFYQRGDYDEGLIYLSRIDKSRFQSESHNPCQDLLTTSASAPTPLNRLLLGSDASSKHKSAGVPAPSDKEAERELNQMPAVTLSPILTGAVNTTLLTKDMKLKSVEGLYSISCHKGYEAQLLREGALATLSGLLKQDDPAIRLYAAAAILNLTHYVLVPISPLLTPMKKAQTQSSSSASMAMAPSQATRDLYAKMMDENVIAALLDLVHTPHPTVKALCARALLRFTIDEAHHFAMVHEGVVTALSQIMATVPTAMTSCVATPNDVKLLCVLALVNLSDVPRAVTCDALLSTVVGLARHGDTATRKICAQAILNLSILPTTRGVIVDEGAVAALEVLAAVAIRPPLQLTLLETITCTLCNLAAVKTNQDALTKNSVLNILSDILTNVGAELRQMQGTTKADTDSIEGEAVVTSLLCMVRKNCVNAIAMLCCNPRLQVRIRNACFIPKLLNILRKDGYDDQDDDYSDDDSHVAPSSGGRRMSVSVSTQRASIDPETEKFVVVALANLALDDRCRPTLVQDGAVPIFLGLLHAPDLPGSAITEAQHQSEGATDNQSDKRVAALLLKLDCVTALSNLLLHPANFQALVDAGVVPAFLDLIRNEETAAPSASNSSKEIQKACVYAMLGLAKDPGMKTRLAEATQKRFDGKEANDQVGAVPTMLAFASRNLANAELCGVCISFLHHLSSRSENHELLYYEGAVGLLVRVLQKPSSAEAPATIYSLWLDCLATLAHLASHTARRPSLLDDGVLDAIQHFLIASAADQRPRDALTDRSIIKAQYAASQIVYKMHEICSGSSVPAGFGPGPVDAPAFFACLLLLATQSASKNSRLSKSTVALQQRTARRTALTIAKVALAVPQGPRLLAEHADIPPALNMVMRTGIHEAQVCAAIALCNLAAERPTPAKGKPLPRVWRDATVDDFIVITLLRVNSPQTKGICAKALFNLLTHEDARDQLMRDGVLYALLKLARLESDSIRDLALRALYNISLDPKKTTQLLEMELVRILAKMYQADLNKTMKRLMVGIFSNLSSASCTLSSSASVSGSIGNGDETKDSEGVSTAKHVELQMLQEGALGVLKNLAKVRDPEMKLYVANVLYNLSCATDSRVAEILVHDESNVLGILVAELKSESRDVRKYAAKTLANLTASSVAVQVMTNDAASAVVSVINDAMKGGKTKTGSTPTGGGSSTPASICVETNCACVFALRNLFSLELNQRKFIACNGLPTLAALLTSPAMAPEGPTLRVATDMICSLAKLNIGSAATNAGELLYEERLVKDGIVRALVAIAKGAMDGSTTRAEENAACMNIVTSLSSLSIHPRCHDGMLRDGALDALALLCATNASDARAPFKGLIGVRGEMFALHCMVVIRNLSRQEAPPTSSVAGPPSIDSDIAQTTSSKAEDVRSQRLTSQTALVPIVLTLSQSTSPQTREHVVVALYNLARLRRSKRQLIKNDGVKVLLRLGTNAVLPFQRHVCALALQALSTQSPPPVPAQPPSNADPAAATAAATASAADWDEPHVNKVVQEGIVAAIAALADSNQHDLLLNVSTNLYAVANPPPIVIEPVSLLRTTNRAIEQRGAPPDWTKVLITDLASWPEIEVGSSRTTAIRVDSALTVRTLSPGEQEEDQGEDSYSDASDDESASRRKGSQLGKSGGKLLGASSSVVSPKKQTQAGPSSTLAPPRVCSSDAVLGWFQLLADPKPEKVRVNVDYELAGRRAVTPTPASHNTLASCGDELPKLRPETAPEGSTEEGCLELQHA
ncbi:hypothetical protein PHYSODRAFT_341804 [Phytophthora sojae]|uniref:Vacuolar protein 8 n=1 Tax=Phytophthora sojae (strain P6497) TaxID=1094619 RepID=G5AEF2_PHYSP|nr:hypothetical protein PHYSODRAFT_341804 [Phytophthora sojae]EGZ06554.1 hypothetical protein PHYSODRAFT_341804 [Phytophthora sojae]|eukprot:XP_009538451.1 hypothetical protein PHYSODRAFT_341804 [Phytophthora sojae]